MGSESKKQEPMRFGDLINLRVEPGVREALREAARVDRTTVSEMMRREIRIIIEARGVKLPDYENGWTRPRDGQ